MKKCFVLLANVSVTQVFLFFIKRVFPLKDFLVERIKKQRKKIENLFIRHLLKTGSADENIDEFINFGVAIHEGTSCSREGCNMVLWLRTWSWIIEKSTMKKKIELVAVCGKNRELVQPLFLLPNYKSETIELLRIIFEILGK